MMVFLIVGGRRAAFYFPEGVCQSVAPLKTAETTKTGTSDRRTENRCR
jgi:hypothetical protein